MIFLAFRSLLARPSRSILTALGIVLGVAVILATSITNLSTLDSINELFDEAAGRADLVVTASDDASGFSERSARHVLNRPGVAAAIPSIQGQAIPVDEAAKTDLNIGFFVLSTQGLLLYGIDPAIDQEARQYEIVAGEFLPPDDNAYEIVLVQDYATEYDIDVGEDLALLAGDVVAELRVSGLMSRKGPGRLNNGAFGVVPLRTAQELFGRMGEIDQIDVVATPEMDSTGSLDQLKMELSSSLGDAYAVGYPASQGRRVTQMIDTYQIGLSFFSAIALFVGAFLIYNAFSMTVVERTREIGLLRAVGMTRGQVLRQILAEATLLAMLGSALGIAAGLGLAKGLIRAMDVVLQEQEVRQVSVPGDGLAASLLVGIGVTLVAAIVPAWQASRVSPLEALRVRSKAEKGWLVRHGWPWGLFLVFLSCAVMFWIPLRPKARYYLGQGSVLTLFVGATFLIPPSVAGWERIVRPLVYRIYGPEGQLGCANIQRAKLRATLTAAALMVGVAMIVGIRGMTAAFKADIEDWIASYIGGDLFVYSSAPMRADLGRRFAALDEVAATTPVRYVETDWIRTDGERERLTFTAIDPDTYQAVSTPLFEGNQSDPDELMAALRSGDTLFVSSALAERFELVPGDTMLLQTRRGLRSFRVAAIVVDFYSQGRVVQGSWNDLRRYFGVNDATYFFVKLEPGEPVTRGQERIQEVYGLRFHLTVENNQELRDQAMRLAAQVFGLFDVLALVAIAVAAFGVVNTLTMSVTERTREIGALRGLGMKRSQVMRMILAEAGLMGVIGTTLGLVFGLFLSRVFLIAVTETRGYDLAYVFPVGGMVVSLLITIILSQLAAIWPARRAARMRIVEAIQYE